MNEAFFINKETGKVIMTINNLKSSPVNISGGNGSYKLPRVYTIKNITENEEFYGNLLNHAGKKLRMESDQINGLFEVSLKDDDIILREYFK